jgi:hypothetical protein
MHLSVFRAALGLHLRRMLDPPIPSRVGVAHCFRRVLDPPFASRAGTGYRLVFVLDPSFPCRVGVGVGVGGVGSTVRHGCPSSFLC